MPAPTLRSGSRGGTLSAGLAWSLGPRTYAQRPFAPPLSSVPCRREHRSARATVPTLRHSLGLHSEILCCPLYASSDRQRMPGGATGASRVCPVAMVQLVPVVCALWQRSASLFQTVPGSAMEQGYGLAREPTFEWFTANLTWAGPSAFARLWTSRAWTLFTNEATEIVLAIRSSHKLLSCVCWLSVLSCCSYNRTDNSNSDFVHTELTVGCTRPYGITWSPPTSSAACW